MMNLLEYPQLAFVAALNWVISAKERLDERGATAVEYGMLVALIAAVIVATVAVLGNRIHTAFTTICNALAGTGTC